MKKKWRPRHRIRNGALAGQVLASMVREMIITKAEAERIRSGGKAARHDQTWFTAL